LKNGFCFLKNALIGIWWRQNIEKTPSRVIQKVQRFVTKKGYSEVNRADNLHTVGRCQMAKKYTAAGFFTKCFAFQSYSSLCQLVHKDGRISLAASSMKTSF
jgi:hypothetical protein